MTNDSFLARALVIDDDAHIACVLSTFLEDRGLATTSAATGQEGMTRFARERPGLVLIDLRLPDMDGLDVLERILALGIPTCAVIVTAHAGVDTAVQALRAGALDYLEKPFGTAQMARLLEVARRVAALEDEVRRLRRGVQGSAAGTDILTVNAAMRTLLDMAGRAAVSDATILLTGESGTGKGLLARYVHERSPRAHGPFVTVDCAGLTGTLLESELFGHAKGAFTGAQRDTPGKLALADGGSVFFDEIGEIPLSLQAKLLRFLQSREIEAVGDSRVRTVDARVIAATNRNLEEMCAAGEFRSDLFYRLNIIEISPPPLRDRPADIPLLCAHHLDLFARRYGKGPLALSDEAMRLLTRHPWPGNVRELGNVMERCAVLATSPVLTPSDLPAYLRETARAQTDPLCSLEEMEKSHIARVVSAAPNYEEAAHILGIDPVTLRRKRKRYGLG